MAPPGLTILGKTVQGTYRLDTDDELEWTMNGLTSKFKIKVTATELEVWTVRIKPSSTGECDTRGRLQCPPRRSIFVTRPSANSTVSVPPDSN